MITSTETLELFNGECLSAKSMTHIRRMIVSRFKYGGFVLLLKMYINYCAFNH
jgi:hypothetical protein